MGAAASAYSDPSVLPTGSPPSLMLSSLASSSQPLPSAQQASPAGLTCLQATPVMPQAPSVSAALGPAQLLVLGKADDWAPVATYATAATPDAVLDAAGWTSGGACMAAAALDSSWVSSVQRPCVACTGPLATPGDWNTAGGGSAFAYQATPGAGHLPAATSSVLITTAGGVPDFASNANGASCRPGASHPPTATSGTVLTAAGGAVAYHPYQPPVTMFQVLHTYQTPRRAL